MAAPDTVYVNACVGAAMPQFSIMPPRLTQMTVPSIVTLPTKSFDDDGTVVPQVGTTAPVHGSVSFSICTYPVSAVEPILACETVAVIVVLPAPEVGQSAVVVIVSPFNHVVAAFVNPHSMNCVPRGWSVSGALTVSVKILAVNAAFEIVTANILTLTVN